MTWNYRVLRHPDGSLALHEVYYDKAGKPNGWTENPISFGVDADGSLPELIGILETALKDAKERPILDVASLDAARALAGNVPTPQDAASGDTLQRFMQQGRAAQQAVDEIIAAEQAKT